MENFKGEIGLFITAILWGLGFIATAVAIQDYNIIEFLVLRFSVASLVLTLIFFKSLKKIDRKNLIYGFVLGSLIFFAFYFQTLGLTFTTTSKNAFLTATNVVIVPMIGLLFYKRKLDMYNTVGAVFTLIGIGFISYNPDFSVNIGDLITLFSAILFAFHIFYTSEFNKREGNATLMSIIQMYVVAIYALIVLILTPNNSLDNLISSIEFNKPFMAILYSGVFSTAICYYLQTTSQKYATESKAAIILSTEAIFGALFSVILLSEVLPPTTIFGCIIVFCAVLFTELKPKWFKFAQTNN